MKNNSTRTKKNLLISLKSPSKHISTNWLIMSFNTNNKFKHSWLSLTGRNWGIKLSSKRPWQRTLTAPSANNKPKSKIPTITFLNKISKAHPRSADFSITKTCPERNSNLSLLSFNPISLSFKTSTKLEWSKSNACKTTSKPQPVTSATSSSNCAFTSNKSKSHSKKSMGFGSKCNAATCWCCKWKKQSHFSTSKNFPLPPESTNWIKSTFQQCRTTKTWSRRLSKSRCRFMTRRLNLKTTSMMWGSWG